MDTCVIINVVVLFIEYLSEVRHSIEYNFMFAVALTDAYFKISSFDNNTGSQGGLRSNS